MFRKLLCCLLTPLFVWTQLFAQKTTMLYADTLQQLLVNTNTASILNDGLYTYFPSRSGKGMTEISTLVKTDTSGNTIWTSYPLLYPQTLEHSYYRLFKRLIKGLDGDLYGLLENNRIIKVQDSNGTVAWMTTVFNGHFDYLRDQILDYDLQHFLFTRADYNTGDLQVFKVEKTFGKKVDSIRLYMPSIGAYFGGGRSYAINHYNHNLIVSTKDSCFKFESFENPQLLWKARHGFEVLQDVARIDVYQNQVLIFGNKYNGFQNGYITSLQLDNGDLAWFSRNQGTFDVNYADHQIKDGFIYTAWKHQYVGSTSERCLINKVNLADGIMQWQFNHYFRTQPVSVAIQEGITQLLLDDQFIYLTGYAQPDNYDKKSWIFLKLNQSNGTIIAKSFVENSDPSSDYPIGFSMHMANNQLYATGFHQNRNATLRLQKNLQHADTPKPVSASIQHPSAVHAIQPFSASKKIIIRRQGKQLLAEMTDPFYNNIWKYPIGDTIDFYESHPQIFSVDSNRSIYVAARRYQYLNNDFFFYPRFYTDSLFIYKLDSTGLLQKRYMMDDDPTVLPLGFFVDSSKRYWRVYQTAGVEYAAPLDTVMAGPFDLVNPRPYATPWRRTIFPHRGDSIIMFRERGYYGGASFTMQGKPYWFPGTVQKFLPGIKWVNHVEQQDSVHYYVAAKDSVENDVIFHYRADSLRKEWQSIFEPSYTTLKIMSGKEHLWLYGMNNQQIVIRRLNKLDGLLSNSFIIQNPMPNMSLTISDIGVSEKRNRISLAGFLTDTAGVPENKLLYISCYDTIGTLLQTIIRGGYKAWQNKSLALAIGQDGQTLVGGQLSDKTWGYAGFLFGLDQQQLATPSADTVYTIASGDWNNPAIWNTGKVPTHESNVLILHPIHITKSIICLSLTIQSLGNISVGKSVIVEVKEL